MKEAESIIPRPGTRACKEARRASLATSTKGGGPMAETKREESERPPGGRPPERRPLGYYYDDGTGYEVYRPEEDDEGEEEEEEEDGGKEKDVGANEGDGTRRAKRGPAANVRAGAARHASRPGRHLGGRRRQGSAGVTAQAEAAHVGEPVHVALALLALVLAVLVAGALALFALGFNRAAGRDCVGRLPVPAVPAGPLVHFSSPPRLRVSNHAETYARARRLSSTWGEVFSR